MFPPFKTPPLSSPLSPRMPWRRARARPTRPRQAPSVGRLKPAGIKVDLPCCCRTVRIVFVSIGESSRLYISVKGRSSILWRLWQCRRACLYLGCIIACQMYRGYFYSRVVRDSLLRIPGLLGDD